MLGKFVRFIRSGNTIPPAHHPLLSRILVIVGNDIAEAPGYAEQLVPAAEAAADYFARQIAAIPGSLALAETRLDADATLATLFPDSADICRALGRSLAVKEALPGLQHNGDGEVHALLGMRLKPGSDHAEGRPLVFADHAVRSLATDVETTREQLRLAAFDRLLLDFAEHVDKLRRKDRMLKIEWEWNRQHDAVRLTAAEPQSEFVYAARELTPPNLLKGLLAWLATPERFFRLETSATTLPGSFGDGGAVAGPIRLPLLHCSDRRQWLVCLARFSVAEGSAALQRETHNHRYILI